MGENHRAITRRGVKEAIGGDCLFGTGEEDAEGGAARPRRQKELTMRPFEGNRASSFVAPKERISSIKKRKKTYAKRNKSDKALCKTPTPSMKRSHLGLVDTYCHGGGGKRTDKKTGEAG